MIFLGYIIRIMSGTRVRTYRCRAPRLSRLLRICFRQSLSPSPVSSGMPWRTGDCTCILSRILPISNAHSPLNILATRPQTREHHGGSPDREAGGGGIPAGGTQRRGSPVDRATRPARRRVGAGPGDLGLRRSRRQRPREGVRGGRKDRGGGRRGDAIGGEGVLGWEGPSYQDQANAGESQQISQTVYAYCGFVYRWSDQLCSRMRACMIDLAETNNGVLGGVYGTSE